MLNLIECELVKRFDPITARADLAVCADDFVYDENADEAIVWVHNIGSRDAGKFRVRIADGDGHTLLDRVVNGLRAPRDFTPQRIKLVLQHVRRRGIKRLFIQLDPDGDVKEITESNNIATCELPAVGKTQ